ncbi:MAG: sodium/proton antiporter, NhaD family [Flavipsychrobacter sp.]|jgi:Na+/H+ antiporter NhaD/arsenite permease-like protein|nr:sodium/proton antiporter, NhaD family [Flavipsychrobacter sp.]
MEIFLLAAFTIGYFLIAIEHVVKINKAAIALVTGVLCWVIYILSTDNKELVTEQLTGHLGELSGILFFLLGAMTVVELIDAHRGFDIITSKITQTNKRKLLWIVSFITFFLSPVLDNLTTAIVMVSLIRKLIQSPEERLTFAGMVVIAANAGGAWSPIGDVTTTMLWLGGQVTAFNITSKLFLPSFACMTVPLVILSMQMRGNVQRPVEVETNTNLVPRRIQYIVLFSGIIILLLVPVFKMLTHLPPYMGILMGLGILWIITEILLGEMDSKERHVFSVAHALRKIDTPSILFFFGLLISIGALEVAGILTNLADWMNTHISNENVIVGMMGLLSSLIDNVPLIAAAQGMYGLNQYPTDHFFWEFLAYCTGTGGSILIIGSAAGVAAMGMEKISFFWYLKKISLVALLGFAAGAGVFFLQYAFL